jgi:hypothetical protein
MNTHDEALVVGFTAAEIAWPIILAMCIALMILPFVFLFVVKRGGGTDEPSQ